MTTRRQPIPFGTPSFGARFVLGSAWLRAIRGALWASPEGLRLMGATHIQFVALPAIGGRAEATPRSPGGSSGGFVQGSCSVTHDGALTVRGGLPILKGGDGSWGLSELPGSTRSACRRSL